MDKENKDPPSGSTPSGVLLIAALAAGLALVRVLPWETFRPHAAPAEVYQHVAEQDIDARLWQDPLAAVGRERKSRQLQARSLGKPDDGGESRRHSYDRFAQQIVEMHCPSSVAPAAAPKTIALGVMVSGGPYPEDAELRRRVRYAVLAALNQVGFVASDPEHLGYFDGNAPSERGFEPLLPEYVAYEWLDPVEARMPSIGPPVSRARKVLLVWLDESHFGRKALARIEHLAEKLDPQQVCRQRWPTDAAVDAAARARHEFVVLGPSSSDMLRELVRSASERKPRSAGDGVSTGNSRHLTFYSYGATAGDKEVLGPLAGDGLAASGRSSVGPARDGSLVNRYFGERNLTVMRTIGADVALAQAIAAELRLHDVDPATPGGRRAQQALPDAQRLPAVSASRGCADPGRPDWQHVVLVADWDTLYGRTIQRTFTGVLAGLDDPCGARRVHSFGYFQGLDGRLPLSGSADPGKEPAQGAEGQRTRAQGTDGKSVERAEGESQYDYLRRLGQRLAALQNDLRRNGQGSIRAIGVLGIDVYDKLQLMQALRPQFPNALFFTTDLDARLMHPRELQWSRNLLVASSFGLQLHPSLQASTPPFRSSYQTAAYLSAMLAMRNALHEHCWTGGAGSGCSLPVDQGRLLDWLATPRIFEVGRDTAFDLSPGPASGTGQPDRADPDCKPSDPAACTTVHPAPSELYPLPTERTLRGFAGLALALVFTLLLVTGKGQAWLGRLPERAERRARRSGRLAGALLAVAAAAAVGLAILVQRRCDEGDGLRRLWRCAGDFLTAQGQGEPLALLAGVSIWPTEAIRLLALALSLGCIGWGWHALDKNADEIAKKMGLEPARREIIRQLDLECRNDWNWVMRLLQMFSYLPTARPGAQAGSLTASERFWHKYLYQSRGRARFIRIALATLLYGLAGYALIAGLGRPSVPFRGGRAELFDTVLLIASVAAMLFLIWFVVDATLLCYRFVHELLSDGAGAADAGRATSDDAGASLWPESVLQSYQERMGLPRKYLNEWISLRFVDLRTRVISRLVYPPFVVISLMILSRSTVFDNWSMPAGLVIIMGLSVLIVLGCAMLLRMAAERARRRAIRRLGTARIPLAGNLQSRHGQGQHEQPASMTVEQLDIMIEQIRALRTGAFAPYSQQPFVRALILPLATYGGTFLAEYLTVASLV